MYFSLILCADNFASTGAKKVDKIAQMDKLFHAWSTNDELILNGLFTEDVKNVSPFGELNGKKAVIEWNRAISRAFGEGKRFNFKQDSSAENSKGDMVVAWSSFPKLVSEFNGLKPHNKYLLLQGASVYKFNDQGLIREFIDHFNVKEFQNQMQGQTAQREQILQTFIDWWSGKVQVEYLKNFIADDYVSTSPFLKRGSFDELTRVVSQFHQSLQIDITHSECNPSSTDNDVWICQFEENLTAIAPNALGMPIGTKKTLDGIFTVRFNENGKIAESTDFVDVQKLYK